MSDGTASITDAAIPCALTELPIADTVDDGLRHIAEHGVTVHRGFLSQDLVERLRERLVEQAEMEQRLGVASLGGKGGAFEQIASLPGDEREHIYQLVDFLPNKGRIFIDLMMSPLPRAYASGVLGGRSHQLWSFGGLISRRGLARQDAQMDQSNLPIEMCTIPAMLNISLCLSEFDPDMGSTCLAPGSHHNPGQPISDEALFISAHANPGDALIWEGRTLHGNGGHDSPNTRFALTLSYGLTAVTPQDVYTSALQDEVYETLDDEELAMLGFQTTNAGFSGRIAPRHGLDRRVNTNRKIPFVPELRRG